MNYELQEKIRQAMRQPFVGNFVFSDDELTEIYTTIGQALRSVENEHGVTLPQSYDDIFFVALVNVAKDWDSDEDRFLNYIFRRLIGTECSGKIYNCFKNTIDRQIEHGNVFGLTNYTKQYYATIISHAFAPQKSILSFFELCWQIYCEDMDQSYDENDDIFNIIARQMQNRFNQAKDDESDIQLGSQIYSFRAGIKGLAIEHSNLLAKLLRYTIKIIHQQFNSETIAEKDHALYLTKLIRSWLKEKEQTFGLVKNTASDRKEHIIADYSQIKPKYAIIDGKVKLSIPPIRLTSDFDRNPYLTITNNGVSVYCEEMVTRGSGLIATTNTIELDLDTLLNNSNTINLSVEITHGEKTVYNSKSGLYRIGILFKDGREITTQDCLPGNYGLFTKDISQYKQRPSKMLCEGNLWSICASNGDILQNDEKTIFFADEKQSREIYIFAEKRNDIVFRFDNEDYDVVDGDLKIAVQNQLNVAEYGVRYESAQFKLSDFPKQQIGDVCYYSITEILSVGDPHKINVFKYADNKVIHQINVVKFKNITVKFDRDFYYDKELLGEVSFVTEKYNHTVKFNANHDEVLVPIENGEIVINPPVLRWKIDDRELSCRYCEQGIWYKNLTNSSKLTIGVPGHAVSIFCGNGETILPETGSSNIFLLGQTVYSLLSTNSTSVEIFAKIDNQVIVPISTVYLKEQLRFPPILILNKQIIWDPQNAYVGDKNSVFTLQICKDNFIVKSVDLNIKRQEISCYELEEDYYQVNILLKKSIFVASRILFNKTICFGNEKEVEFRNKTLKISSVVLSSTSKETTIRPVYIDEIHFLQSRDNSDFYKGKLFIKSYDGRKIYLNQLQNDFGIYENINPVRIEIMNKRSCWLVSGIIGNDIDDFLAEFTLDWENKLSNCDRNTKAIDYYIFEVMKNV